MGKIISVALSAFHHFAGENYSRAGGNYFKNDDEKIALAKLLAEGYNPTRDGAVLLLVPLTEAEIKLAVEEREATWKAYKEANVDLKVKLPGVEKDREINIGSSDTLIQFEEAYTKNGKVIPPKYRAVWAFRRFSVMMLANAIAKKIGNQPIKEVPAQVQDSMTEKERMFACVLENTKKDIGTKTLDWNDLLTAAYSLYVVGATQGDLRKTFKDGTGQKLWYLLVANAQFPKANLLEDLKSGKLKVTKSPMDIKDLLEDGVYQEEENGPAIALTDDTIAKALQSKAVTKQMSGKDIKAIGKQSNVEIFRDTCNAIAVDNVAFFKAISMNAEAVNMLNEAYAKVRALLTPTK